MIYLFIIIIYIFLFVLFVKGETTFCKYKGSYLNLVIISKTIGVVYPVSYHTSHKSHVMKNSAEFETWLFFLLKYKSTAVASHKHAHVLYTPFNPTFI